MTNRGGAKQHGCVGALRRGAGTTARNKSTGGKKRNKELARQRREELRGQGLNC